MLRRKIDDFLMKWKSANDRKPLIVKGARQIGKTFSINAFARSNYQNVVSINFILEKKYQRIFNDGYDVDSIVKNISFFNPSFKFVPGQTLIFFDEIQACPDCATSLKSFQIDGRFDVICSGSLMGINYQEMHSLDFEEFLWAKGYSEATINELLVKMENVIPLSSIEMDVFSNLFCDYMMLGGMPAVVNSYVTKGNFSGTLKMQQQLLADYEEDITKYAQGLDKGRIKNIYSHISVFLAQENKKFQISKVSHGARSREYAGVVEWLADAGIVNVCYCLEQPSLPLRGNYNPRSFKLYYRDTGLLIASLDEEAQQDLRANRNFGTYKGAIYENIIADMLVKQGYELYYYKNEKSTVEMDFFVRDADSLVPVEVKAKDGATASLNNLIKSEAYPDVKYGIKFCHKNIGFNGQFFTLPYFLTFLLRRFLKML